MAKKDDIEKCCLCGRGESPTRPLLTGRSGSVCAECVQQAYNLCKDAGFVADANSKRDLLFMAINSAASIAE